VAGYYTDSKGIIHPVGRTAGLKHVSFVPPKVLEDESRLRGGGRVLAMVREDVPGVVFMGAWGSERTDDYVIDETLDTLEHEDMHNLFNSLRHSTRSEEEAFEAKDASDAVDQPIGKFMLSQSHYTSPDSRQVLDFMPHGNETWDDALYVLDRAYAGGTLTRGEYQGLRNALLEAKNREASSIEDPQDLSRHLSDDEWLYLNHIYGEMQRDSLLA